MAAGRFWRRFLYQIPMVLISLMMIGLSWGNDAQGAEKKGNPGSPVERTDALDYKGIYDNLTQDLTREKETQALDEAQWKIFRDNLDQWDLQIKGYRVQLSALATSLISETHDLKKMESDWNLLKPMTSGLEEPIRQIQKRIQTLGESLARVEEKISLNKAYSGEVRTAVDTSNSEAARLRKNFQELDQIHQKKKQTITELLDAYKKSLADLQAIKTDSETLSEKYSQELVDRKKEVLFEKGESPLGNLSVVGMARAIIDLYPQTLEMLKGYADGEKGYGVIVMNLVVFAFLLTLWLFMLVRLRSLLDDLAARGWFGTGQPLENLCAMVRRSIIPVGLVVYFHVYGLMVDAVLYASLLTLFVQLFMAFLIIDWLIFSMGLVGRARELIHPRRLAFWNLFLRGLFPIIGVNLVFHLLYVYNHMIPVFLRLVLGLYLLAGFFVMTFRLKFSTEYDPGTAPGLQMPKLVVALGNLILLAGLLMELFGYGALSIYWYLAWVYSVAIFIWSWHLFSLLMDLRSKQKQEVTRDPYFSQVLSYGHPVKWFFLQVGWVAWFAITLVLVVLAWSSDWAVMARIFSFLNHPFVVGSLTFSIMNLFYAAFTVGATHVATRLWKYLLLTKILVDSGFEKSVQNSISMITVYTMWMFGILLALHVFGLGTTSLTVAFGALGIGLGFGLQNIFNNFISGIILLFERPIQVGDDIEINGIWANVRKINVRSTIVQTYDNASLIIPNSDFISAQVINWTLRDKRIRIKINVGVAYGSDVNLVRESLLEIARSNSMVLVVPKPDVVFADFGASSLDFVLRVWTNVDQMIVVGTEIRFAIDRVFRERKISIAFPQLDVHLDRQE